MGSVWISGIRCREAAHTAGSLEEEHSQATPLVVSSCPRILDRGEASSFWYNTLAFGGDGDDGGDGYLVPAIRVAGDHRLGAFFW